MVQEVAGRSESAWLPAGVKAREGIGEARPLGRAGQDDQLLAEEGVLGDHVGAAAQPGSQRSEDEGDQLEHAPRIADPQGSRTAQDCAALQPPPDLAARLAYVEERTARDGPRLEMRPEELAAQTTGLHRHHIEDVALRAGWR